MTPRPELLNPFDADVVANPDQAVAVDVREIHQSAFDTCRREYGQLHQATASRSILFFGQAGCGKTHLLARFRRWLCGELEDRPPAAPAVFVSVRMETAPSHVWRYLQRRFAEHLLERAPDGRTLLDGILDRFATRHGGGDLEVALDEHPVTDITLDLARVLEHFAVGRHRRQCRAWMKGDSLTERDLQEMGLSGRQGDSLDDESGEGEARRFVLPVTRLCAPEPVVFCFDQLEALGLAAHANSYGPFARMGASLVDETANALVISSILATYVPELERQAMRPDYQRITKATADLQPLNWEQGKKLIEARLDAAEDLRPYRPQGGLAPLEESGLRLAFDAQHGRCAARRLIHEAKRLFEAWQGAPARPRVALEEFLSGAMDRLRETSEAHTAAAHTDEILAHGLPEAARLARRALRESRWSEVDFEAGPEDSPILVAFCNQRHMTGLARKLDRLKRQVGADRLGRLCLVRDARLAITPTARTTRERLRKIEEAGGRLLRPDVEAVAAVDAMRLLLTRATSGDLSHDGETVPADRVRAWLEANLPGPAASILEGIAGGAADRGDDALLALLEERKLLAVEEAARELGWQIHQVEDYARAHPDRAGLLGGRAPVVFHVVPEAAGGGDARA